MNEGHNLTAWVKPRIHGHPPRPQMDWNELDSRRRFNLGQDVLFGHVPMSATLVYAGGPPCGLEHHGLASGFFVLRVRGQALAGSIITTNRAAVSQNPC